MEKVNKNLDGQNNITKGGKVNFYGLAASGRFVPLFVRFKNSTIPISFTEDKQFRTGLIMYLVSLTKLMPSHY